jgi:hypothetical protein
MTDARSLSPQLPALKLRIVGPHVDPISGWAREQIHHTLEGYLQAKAVRTMLPSEF